MGMVPTSMCICGHAKGYHDSRELPPGTAIDICSIWGCSCMEYETVADVGLVEAPR